MENERKEAKNIIAKARIQTANDPDDFKFGILASAAGWLTLRHVQIYLEHGEEKLRYEQKWRGKPSLVLQYPGLKQKQVRKIGVSNGK